MKKLLKLLLIGGALAGLAWALRDRLVPGPVAPTAHPPAFRNPPPASGVHSAPVHSAPTATRPASSSTSGDDLTRVNGIGPVYAGRLTAAGVTTFRQLADANAEELAARTELPPERIADWIGKAADLA